MQISTSNFFSQIVEGLPHLTRVYENALVDITRSHPQLSDALYTHARGKAAYFIPQLLLELGYRSD